MLLSLFQFPGLLKHSVRILLVAAVIAFVATEGSGEIVINEFMAAASDRRLTWDDDGSPRLGSGLRWSDPEFDASQWSNGFLPAGYGYSGLLTVLSGTMKDKACSLYLRKEFVVTQEQIDGEEVLQLRVQFNDGFVAYLNGREVARANCGPTNHFMFASQPAYNVNSTTNVSVLSLGSAAISLRKGTNLLAIQAHNADNPNDISAHIQTPEFYLNAGLRLADATNSLEYVDLLPLGPGAGKWSYFVGRTEPCGGVADLGLATRTFTPPGGEEDDFEQPAEFSDWVELFNNGTTAVDLAGWSLSDDLNLPAKWHFPDGTVLAAGGYLLVLCDNRDEANAPLGPALYLHANFKLSAEGDALVLSDQYGRYVDGPVLGYPRQVFYCSYGRPSSNPSTFAYLRTATPGAANTDAMNTVAVDPPVFSMPGGIYTNPVLSLELSHTNPAAVIRYTLNGTEPKEGSSLVYSSPLGLAQANEKTGIVVRARAFLPGAVPSETVTHSYLLRRPASLSNSPALFLTGEAGRTFYLPDGVLAIFGGQYVDSVWRASGTRTYNNVLGSGTAYEREAHLEYYFPPGYYPSGQQPFRAGIGLRVSASPWQRPRMTLTQAATSSPWSTGDTTQKPSFNVYFKGDYGPSTLEYPLFTNYSVTRFEHLRLRAGKNDNRNPFITDELIRRLFQDMGHESARGLFSSLYVNGVYKGIYNVTERVREAFFQAHYNSELEWDVCYSGSWVNGDNVAYQQLVTALDRNLTNLVNWGAVADRIYLDNVCDYYLLNIYTAMWDWPGNNYVLARERSTGPNGKFRFAVWDAEGGFNAVGYGKAASFNTLTTDLLVNGSQPPVRIFRRLATSPEFRLRFADRINYHMFNGGTLDDRDPDGGGPLKSQLRARLDELVKEAGDLVRYNSGQTLSTSVFLSWMSSTSGRRAFLLGTTTGRRMFRDAGFWPVTEPPVFTQYGGIIEPGFSLGMSSSVAVSNQISSIYYTLDGTDPRVPGALLSSHALLYETPIPLVGVVTVKARARNVSTGEWSALTEATFTPPPVAANSTNLAVGEIMYNPPAPSGAELAEGFSDKESFEFIRLLNISQAPVHLGGVRFTAGITFDFSTVPERLLMPGKNVLLVKNRGAFHARYGAELDQLVAGEYSGNLANGGELLRIVDTNSVVVREFAYGDQPPWPSSPDGTGPSLILANPFSNPDHVRAANWVASAIPGGLPSGTGQPQTYDSWRNLFWDPASRTDSAISGPEADPDGDGLCNRVEYACGLDPQRTSVPPCLVPEIAEVAGQKQFFIETRLAYGPVDAMLGWQTLGTNGIWQPITSIEKVEVLPNPDGSAKVRFIERTPLDGLPQRFLRLQIW